MSFLAKLLVALAVNAIALLVAALLLDKFTISELTFPIVVVVYTAIGLLVLLVLDAVFERHAQSFSRVVGLVAVWLTLLITDIVSDGLQIEGAGTWILATAIVWAGALAASYLIGSRLERKVTGNQTAG